jgi:LuxR family maltose regulon positive regulatory protein
MIDRKAMSGATPLLLTKLRHAALPDAYVPRPGLCARLAATLSIRLTLISAPPGFGRTTLLAEWLDKVARCRSRRSPALPG